MTFTFERIILSVQNYYIHIILNLHDNEVIDLDKTRKGDAYNQKLTG